MSGGLAGEYKERKLEINRNVQLTRRISMVPLLAMAALPARASPAAAVKDI